MKSVFLPTSFLKNTLLHPSITFLQLLLSTVATFYSCKHERTTTHLCSGEEHVIRYVAHTTGNNAQSHPREHIGIVTLARIEGATIRQCHLIEGAPTSKDSPALKMSGRQVTYVLTLQRPISLAVF